MTLQDAVVVVIGGSSGIGLATARAAKDAGARVTIAGRDKDRLGAALEDLGDGATGMTCDVSDEGSVRDLFAEFDHVDHVANFAGSHVNGPITELDTAEMRANVDGRFWGPVHVFKYAAPKMTDGSVTICTGAGVAKPRPGGSIVSAGCGGSEYLALAMASELAPVRVNVIRPGIIDTPLLDRMVPGADKSQIIDFMTKRIPLKRVGRPEEIADGVLFLMRNGYVTGTTLTIDGGSGLV